MKKKLLSLMLSAAMITTVAAGCGKSDSGTIGGKAPTFPSGGRGVTFAAYAAPTVNRGVDGLTEEHYKKLSEAGFNKAIALYEGSSNAAGGDIYETIAKRSEKAEADALKVLNLAEKYNVKYFVRDWSFYGLGKNFAEIKTKEDFDKVISKMFDKNNKYINHNAYGGNFGFDEPNVQEMETIAWQAELYNKYIAQNGTKGGEIFVNLLPGYVMDNSAALSENKDTTYRQYVDYYFNNVIQNVGYVCWDFYPLMKTASDENYIRDMYYYNYELMAEKCKNTDYEVRTFVQAKGDFTGTRNITGVSDFRWQIYSGMAFGCREFVYYTYSSEHGVSDYTKNDGYSLYNYTTGEYTYVYEAAKHVNNEVHAMQDAYDAYKWDGVMYKNASEMVDNQLFENLMNPIEKHDRIKVKECSLDTLVGVFKAKDVNAAEQDAFMIVNANEPSEDKDNTVTVQFQDATQLLMYRLGQRIIVPLGEDGTYTFKLYPGEGRFVIPVK